MKYKLILDENNYLQGFIHTNTEEDIYELNASEMKLDYLNCYKLVGDVIIFDEEKYNALVDTKSKEDEIARLKQELTKYDYIGVKLAMGVATKEEYAEQIAYTETIREQIRQLETFRTESEQPKEV